MTPLNYMMQQKKKKPSSHVRMLFWICVLRDLCSFTGSLKKECRWRTAGCEWMCWKLTRNYMYLYISVSLYTCFHLFRFPYSLFTSLSRHVDLSSVLSFISISLSCSSSSFPCVRCSRSGGASEEQGAGRRGRVHQRCQWRDARGENSGGRDGCGAEDWAACRRQLRGKLCK